MLPRLVIWGCFTSSKQPVSLNHGLPMCSERYVCFALCHHKINNNNLQAFQLIILARYLLGMPKPLVL